MSEPKPPTAEGQLAFLRSLQRLLDEGSFTSSYKFALLHAIADLCVIKGHDSGAELEAGFDQRKALHDWAVSRRIAHWAYGQVHRAGGQVWVQAKERRPLSDGWRRILVAADHAA